MRRSLADGLNLGGEGGVFWVARDWRSDLEHLWSAASLRDRGLFVDLHAYDCRVFLDWREVRDDVDGTLWRLAERLGGSGVPSVEEAQTELRLEPVREPFWRLLEAGAVLGLIDAVEPRPVAKRASTKRPTKSVGKTVVPSADRSTAAIAALENTVRWMAEAVHAFAARSGAATPTEAFAENLVGGLGAALSLARSGAAQVAPTPENLGTILAWLATRELGGEGATRGSPERSRRLFDEWRLGQIVAMMFRGLGLEEEAVARGVDHVRALIDLPPWPVGIGSAPAIASAIVRSWLANPIARQALQVHEWDEVEWFDGDAWSELVERSLAIEAVRLAEADKATPAARAPAAKRGAAKAAPAAQPSLAALRSLATLGKEVHRLGPASGYRVDHLAGVVPPRDGRTRTSEPERRTARGKRRPDAAGS
jgi:hypothetical protein